MFDFNFNWDWSGFNLDALAEPMPALDNNWLAQVEREIAVLSTVATEAVVNSSAVIQAPVNTAPDIDAVEQSVQQVVQAIAPVVAPSLPDYILQLTIPLFVDEIAYSPEVLAAPVGQTVAPKAVETIVNNIIDTAVKDETFVNSVVASIPDSLIQTLPEEDKVIVAEAVSQANETVSKAPDASSATMTPTPTPTVTTPSTVAAGESGTIGARSIDAQKAAEATLTPTPTITADADPLAALQTSVAESKAQVEKKNIEIPTIALEQAINAGDTDAIRAAADALGKAQGLTGSELRTFSYKTTQDAAKGTKPTPPPTDANFTYDYVWKQDVGGPGGEWTLIKSPIMGAGASVTGTVTGGTSTGGTGTGGTSTVTVTTARTLGRDQFKSSLALFFGPAEASKPWVDALYDVVSKFYRTGSDIDQSFNLALQDARNNPALKPFTDRFKGIYALQDLKLTGKPVLVPTIAEYVVSQAKMADVLTEANLGSIATDEFTTELISKGNSVTTIADKIAKAYLRIDMAPKAIKDTLSRFFPTVDRTTLAKTLLLGEKGVNQLVDELEQYEVLAAAEQQGLGAINRIGGVDLGRAQEYARSGKTFTSLTPQFSQIARALPTTTKLSQISKVEDIGQIGLEKALIGQSAEELEKLELLGEQEISRYKGKAGRAELGLASRNRAAGII